MKYNKMGCDVFRYFMVELYRKMSHILLALGMLRQQPRDLLMTIRRRNLRGGMTFVVLEMDICAMLEQ